MAKRRKTEVRVKEDKTAYQIKDKYLKKHVYLFSQDLGKLVSIGGDSFIPAKPPKKSRTIKEATNSEYKIIFEEGFINFFEPGSFEEPEVTISED